jgi:hypothetical protein
MDHVAIDQPQQLEPQDAAAAQSDTPGPEIESLMLPGIAELPELSEFPAWLRRPLERIKRIKKSR